jgi:hypothetical protein
LGKRFFQTFSAENSNFLQHFFGGGGISAVFAAEKMSEKSTLGQFHENVFAPEIESDPDDDGGDNNEEGNKAGAGGGKVVIKTKQ